MKEGAVIPIARATKNDDDGGDKEAESPEGDGSQVERFAAKDAKTKSRKVGKITESSTSGGIVTIISRLFRAFIEAISTIGPPLRFDPLKIFFYYLEVEFGGIDVIKCATFRTSRKKSEIFLRSCMHVLRDLHGDVFT